MHISGKPPLNVSHIWSAAPFNPSFVLFFSYTLALMSKLLKSRRRGRAFSDSHGDLSEQEDAVSLASHDSVSDSESNPSDTEDSDSDMDGHASETEENISSGSEEEDEDSSVVSSEEGKEEKEVKQGLFHCTSLNLPYPNFGTIADDDQVQKEEGSGDANVVQEKQDQSQEESDKKWKNLTVRERQILERLENRRRLAEAEEASFVPNAGQFWTHDDRTNENGTARVGDEAALNGTVEGASMDMMPRPRADGRPIVRKHRQHRRVPEKLINSRWTHDGYEELCRIEEQEEKEKREYKERGEPWPPKRKAYNRIRRDGQARKPKSRSLHAEEGGANASWNMASAEKLANDIASWPALTTQKIPAQVDDTNQDQNAKDFDSGWSTTQKPSKNETDGWGSAPAAVAVDTWDAAPTTETDKSSQSTGQDQLAPSATKVDDTHREKETKEIENGWSTVQQPSFNKDDGWGFAPADVSVDTWNAAEHVTWKSEPNNLSQPVDPKNKSTGISKESSKPAQKKKESEVSRDGNVSSLLQGSMDDWKADMAKGWKSFEKPTVNSTDTWATINEPVPSGNGWDDPTATEISANKALDTWSATQTATDIIKEDSKKMKSPKVSTAEPSKSHDDRKDDANKEDDWKNKASKGWSSIESPMEKNIDLWQTNVEKDVTAAGVDTKDGATNGWNATKASDVNSTDAWTDTKDTSAETDGWKAEAAKGWGTVESAAEKNINTWSQPQSIEETAAATDSWKIDATSTWQNFKAPAPDLWPVGNQDIRRQDGNDTWNEGKEQQQTATVLEDEEWVSSGLEKQPSQSSSTEWRTPRKPPFNAGSRSFKERRRPDFKNIEDEKASSAWSSWASLKQNDGEQKKAGRGYLSQKKKPSAAAQPPASDAFESNRQEEGRPERTSSEYKAAATRREESKPSSGLLFPYKKERPVANGQTDIFDFETMKEPWNTLSEHKRNDATGHERFIEEGDASDQDSDVEILVDEGDAPPPVSWNHREVEENVERDNIPTPPSAAFDRGVESPDSRHHSESPGAPPYMPYPPHPMYYPPDPSAYYGMPAYPVPFMYPGMPPPPPPPAPAQPSSQDGSTDSQTPPPTAYQANGMVYYGMDPAAAMYQYYYYYYPPGNATAAGMAYAPKEGEDYDDKEDNDEGWGPEPENRHNGGWEPKQQRRQQQADHAMNGGGYYYYPAPNPYPYL